MTTMMVTCAASCRGTLTLTARLAAGRRGGHRDVAITPAQYFEVSRARGGSVAVRLRVDRAGRAAVAAAARGLPVVAVLRYASAGRRSAETDRYRMTLYRSR
jgi:hypothetical protein